MGEANRVIIEIIADTKKTTQGMREFGEKLTALGMRVAAAFTLPLTGAFALLAKNPEVQKALKPVSDAFDMLSTNVAKQLLPLFKELQPLLIDIAYALGDVFNSFLPSIREALPMIKDFLGWISDGIRWFAGLNKETKDLVVKVILIGAALGVLIPILGQVIWFFGTLGSMAPAVWALVAPIAAVGLAVYALIKLFEMDEFKKGLALLAGAWTTSDPKKRALVTQGVYQSIGGGASGSEDTGNMIRGLLGASQSQASAAPVVINYQPTFSAADQYEFEQKMKPLIEQVLRQRNGR